MHIFRHVLDAGSAGKWIDAPGINYASLFSC